MKLLIAISTRYYQTPDELVWTKTTYDRAMWGEIQEVFPEVKVFARLIRVAAVPESSRLASGPGIEFCSLPEWNSKTGILRLPNFLNIARSAVLDSQAVILHSPSFEADLAWFWARRANLPIALECRGEQALSAAYWKKRGLIFPEILAAYHRSQMHRHLRTAWGCVFVAEQLRNHYTKFLKAGSQSTVISDARIPDRFFLKKQFDNPFPGQRVCLVNIGRLEAQKDQATLLKACAQLAQWGIAQWELHLIGEGPLRQDLEQQAQALGIYDKVVFHGFVPWGDDLFCLLEKMDLFVLSSLNEGMPRVLIEAMARGLSCISTNVSGAGELLGCENLVPVGNPVFLAGRIAELIKSPEKRGRLAGQCWSSVQNFRMGALKERKKQFLRDFYTDIQDTR